MTPIVVGATLLAGIGAIVALSPRDPRIGLLGLTAALVGAAFVVDPLPSPQVLGVRISGALLAVVLLRVASLGPTAPAHVAGWTSRPGRGSEPEAHPGWPAIVLLAAAGGVAGLAAGLGLDAGGLNPVATTQLALVGLFIAIGLGPALVGPLGIRRGFAATMVVAGVALLRQGLGAQLGVLDEVIDAALLVGVAAAVGVLVIGLRARSDEAPSEPARPPIGGRP